MTRPKLHNEKNAKLAGRPGAYSAPESFDIPEENITAPEVTPKAKKKGVSDLESFLMAQKKEEKEPVRTITFRMPESLFKKFENLRDEMDMNRTDLLLYLIKFAHETRSGT